MKSWQDRAWSVVEYAPPIATLLFGTYVGLESIRQPQPVEKMLSWCLVVLLLIATTQLVDRARSLRLIRDQLESLPGKFRQPSSLLTLPDQELNFRRLAGDASHIDIVAWSCNSFFDDHDGFLESKIRHGCQIRIVIVAEGSSAASVIMECAGIKEFVGDLDRVKAKVDRFCRELAHDTRGTFELRESSWLTPYGLILVDGVSTGSVASVGLHPLYLPTARDSRRFFLVNSQSSPKDFAYFRDQFELLWNSAPRVSFSENREQNRPPKKPPVQPESAADGCGRR